MESQHESLHSMQKRTAPSSTIQKPMRNHFLVEIYYFHSEISLKVIKNNVFFETARLYCWEKYKKIFSLNKKKYIGKQWSWLID